MTDGPTAIQVSPVTESEMAKLTDIVQRACNAIVGYSQLGRQVAELTAKVDALTHEVERVREENKFLAENLYSTRKERDEARADAQEAHGALVIARSDIAKANDRIAYLDQEVSKKIETIFRLERESDEHLLRAMHAEEELEKFKSKLEEAEAWMDGLKTMLHPVKEPEPTPEPEVQEPEVSPVTPFPNVTATAMVDATPPTPPHVEEEKPRDYTWPLPGYSHS